MIRSWDSNDRPVKYLASGDRETLRTEAEDKELDSNGDAETLHAEAKNNLLDTIEEWALSKSAHYCILRALALLYSGNYPIQRALALSHSGNYRVLQALALPKSGNYRNLRALALFFSPIRSALLRSTRTRDASKVPGHLLSLGAGGDGTSLVRRNRTARRGT